MTIERLAPHTLACYNYIGVFGWLFNGMSTQAGQSVPTECGGGKPAQSAKDGQRDTMHITLHYALAM